MGSSLSSSSEVKLWVGSRVVVFGFGGACVLGEGLERACAKVRERLVGVKCVGGCMVVGWVDGGVAVAVSVVLGVAMVVDGKELWLCWRVKSMGGVVVVRVW